VLTGLQVPPAEIKAFAAFLTQIGFRCWDETHNVACQTFLAPD